MIIRRKNAPAESHVLSGEEGEEQKKKKITGKKKKDREM